MRILAKLELMAGLGFSCGVLSAWAAPVSAPTFNRDIRPILSDNCYACHGPDKNTRKAKLRLDHPDDAYAEKEGRFPLVPGKPENSEVINRITSLDPEEVMPPTKTGKKLTPQQIVTIRQWIEAGAKYDRHWAYIPSQRPSIPAVRNTSWPLNPIDNFILARLESENLVPSPDADNRTLVRRLSFDVNGLPPTAEQIEAFGKSKDSDAYTRLVRTFLNSPHFGERMAVHWLDLVRYADTVGYHGDTPVSVWPYRDYVINAFNQNLRYDQFTREQLAGDLLPHSSLVHKVASGFNRLNRMSTEGGIQDKEYLAKYAADRVRTVSAVWMGSTMGCAECHDHKFDPFSTKDFYQMEAFFADLKEKGYYPDGFGKEDWGPKISVPASMQAKRLSTFNQQIAALTNKIAALPQEDLQAGQSAWERRIDWLAKGDRLRWKEVMPTQAVSSGGSTLTIQTNATVLATGKVPDQDDYTVTIPAILPRITAVRLEVMRDESLPGNEIARAGDTFVLGEIDMAVRSNPAAQPKRIKIHSATASFSYDGFPIMAAIDGNPETGWAQGPRPTRDRIASFVLDRPVRGGPDVAMIVTLRHSRKHPRQQMGKFRLSLTEVESAHHDKATVPTNVLTALKVAVDQRTTNQQQVISAYYRTIAPESRRTNLELARRERDRMLLLGEIPTMLVSESTNARPVRILPRGNWMTDSGALVTPGTPHFLPTIAGRTNGLTRLDLANWFVSTNNPLTARVFVNRLWKIYFGTGLSRTLDDFGIQGEWPTHPELLDWLATEFMESGWDMKHMVTLIVSSRTYRQSSQSTPMLDDRDPLNRLLARQSRFRLDAEFVRDNALAVSGLLIDKQGGPSAHPYQPDGYYAPLNFPHREYVAEEGEGQYRRGVYTHWQRTFLHPSLLAFDASPREECTVNRVNSNTPLQALALLNDPTYVEAARVFAAHIVRRGGNTFESRLEWAYRKALCRSPRSAETALVRELYEKQLANYRAHESAARELLSVGFALTSERLPLAELAAWTSVARALLNLNETITRS